MPEVLDQPAVGSENGTSNTGNQQTQAPGWMAALPDDLKGNEALKSYKTIGDLTKSYLETDKKAKEYEGKLANSIPKLGENATQEERDKFFNSLGRPEKPDGYGLTKNSKNASEWDKYWENKLFERGVSLDTAMGLKQDLDAQMTQLVEQHNANLLKENEKAATELKTELGDKYDASVVLASRLWKEWGKTEVDFDKAFATETSANRVTMMRFLLNVAAKTGEDSSLRGSGQRQETKSAFINYDKSPKPPRKG